MKVQKVGEWMLARCKTAVSEQHQNKTLGNIVDATTEFNNDDD